MARLLEGPQAPTAAISNLAQFVTNCQIIHAETKYSCGNLSYCCSTATRPELIPLSCDPYGELSGFPPLTRSIVFGSCGGEPRTRRRQTYVRVLLSPCMIQSQVWHAERDERTPGSSPGPYPPSLPLADEKFMSSQPIGDETQRRRRGVTASSFLYAAPTSRL